MLRHQRLRSKFGALGEDNPAAFRGTKSRVESQASAAVHDPAVPSLLADVHVAYHILGRLLRARLEEADVSMSEALVLRVVALNRRVSMSSLVITTALARPTVTCLVQRLEERGYVRRSRVGDDRRMVYVTPRRPGLAIAMMTAAAIDELTAALMPYATAADVARLGEVARALDIIERPERPSRLG
jgi:MarR family transcriptional regulator, organic hydroperoxide resistance regulator